MKKTKSYKNKDVSASFKIPNATGLHARAAAAFVKVAKQFPAEIVVKKGKLSVNGKSILGVLMLGAEQGQIIEVMAKGLQAKDALDQLSELILAGFHE